MFMIVGVEVGRNNGPNADLKAESNIYITFVCFYLYPRFKILRTNRFICLMLVFRYPREKATE